MTGPTGFATVPHVAKKSAPGNRRVQQGAVVAESRTLDPVEEKVVRMRKGWGGPDDLELEQVGSEHEATRAKLREIELRALEMSGRMDELRREAGVGNSPTKQKIIDRLNAKQTTR